MRRSNLTHAVAVLRETIGMRQKDFANLLNRSVHSLQSIELGRLDLSESLANDIAAKTGVSFSWLMNNDVSSPIVGDDRAPYTKEKFERTQAKAAGDANDYFQTLMSMSALTAWIAWAHLAALKNGETDLLAFRLSAAVRGAMKGIGGGHLDLLEKWSKAALPARFPGDANDAQVADAFKRAAAVPGEILLEFLSVFFQQLNTQQASLNPVSKSSPARRSAGTDKPARRKTQP